MSDKRTRILRKIFHLPTYWHSTSSAHFSYSFSPLLLICNLPVSWTPLVLSSLTSGSTYFIHQNVECLKDNKRDFTWLRVVLLIASFTRVGGTPSRDSCSNTYSAKGVSRSASLSINSHRANWAASHNSSSGVRGCWRYCRPRSLYEEHNNHYHHNWRNIPLRTHKE